MTTFMKTKLKKSDDLTNIDKYRVAANITEYHIMYYIKINLPKNYHFKIHDVKAIITCKNLCKNQLDKNGPTHFFLQ